MSTALLNTIDSPADLRRLSRPSCARWPGTARLRARQRQQDRRPPVSNLGTVELTIALHYVFNTPHDRWSGTWATRPTRTRS
jgi:1-deoxy-D-xylulose-5-phosphate synthase